MKKRAPTLRELGQLLLAALEGDAHAGVNILERMNQSGALPRALNLMERQAQGRRIYLH